MDKPKQTMQFEKNPDNDTLLEELESAMFSITEAMENLRGYEQFSDWFDMLDAMFDEMEPEREQYEIQAGVEYNKEIEGLTRDYYRMVM